MRFLHTFLLITVAAFPANSQNLSLGLQACYPFDNTAQNSATTGAVLDGTIVNAGSTTGHTGLPNTAIKLNGDTSSYIVLPDHPGVKSDPIFFAGWFKFDTLTWHQYLVFTNNGCTSNFEAYSLLAYHVSPTIKQQFRLSKTSSNCSTKPEINSTTSPVAGTWYHVAFFISNTVMKLYVNGALEASTNHVAQFAYVPGKKVYLGVTNEPQFNNPMKGSIDNVRFYNRELSLQELNLLMSQDPPCVEPPPVPTSAFNISQNKICAGNNIAFTDQSTQSPTSWNWQFQGGNPATSTQQNPTVNFPTAGVYTVALTASNVNGAGNTSIQTVTVEACTGVPSSIFTASQNKICAGNNISFIDQSTELPASWNWHFQGGNPATSTQQNPIVNYPAAGVYTVALTASNVGGAGNTSIQTVTVEVCTGVYDLHGSGRTVEIYPNPATDRLLIRGLDDNRFDLFDLPGKPMKALPAFATQNDQTVDLRGLAPGIYFIQIRDTRGQHLQTIKLIKSE